MKSLSTILGLTILLWAGVCLAKNTADDTTTGVEFTFFEDNFVPEPFPFDDGYDLTAYWESEEGWAAEESVWESDAMATPMLLASCSPNGWCHYNYDAFGTPIEIHCIVPEGSALDTLVGLKYELPGRLHVCTYTGGALVETGWCDVSAVRKLLVEGKNSTRDSIGIIRHIFGDDGTTVPVPGADCNFNEFKDTFEPMSPTDSAQLKIDGRGMYDWIYGSQFDDKFLIGEYVDGREGDDMIYLSTGEIGVFATHTTAYGNYGADTIFGTSAIDWVSGDDVSTGSKPYGGQDTIYGYADNDLLAGGWYDDTIYGGLRNDTIWGGDEEGGIDGDNGDFLYGEEFNDTIYGMDGNDEIHGGDGNDILRGHEAGPDDDGDLNDRCFGEAGTDTCVCDYINSCP